MHILLLITLASIYRINGHGQHDKQGPADGQPQVPRKMEDYVHDMDHMRHDLEGQINKPKEELTPEEQNFYYFKLHDSNNDNLLDGLEVIAAFNHAHHEDNDPNAIKVEGQNSTQTERMGDEELTSLIDDILKEEDLDRDGFISYEEFKQAMEVEKKTQG